MQHFENSELKALFDQLVTAVGTHEAAATFLGVSRQRIGQLISTGNNDLPTWAQVAKLEDVCKQSIVFGHLARRQDAGATGADALTAGVAAAGAITTALGTVHSIMADGQVDAHEADRAQDDARKALEAAQRHFDATMKLRPTLRVVGQ